MQVKAKYTSVPDQYDVRRSHQKQNTRQRNQPGTNNTTKHQANQTKQKAGHAKRTNQSRRSHKHQPRQRTTRRADKTNKTRARGEGDKRRPARKERADAREGSRGRREKAAQAKKADACSFSGVRRVFWITRGRIPQWRSEGHMTNTHKHGVEGRAPQGRSLCLPGSGVKTGANQPRHAMPKATGPLQIQPDIRREGPAELTGPEKTRRQPRGEIFFRPTPSWLPPGRYTRSIAAKRWIVIIMQGCLLVDSHKSTGSGPVRSPVGKENTEPHNGARQEGDRSNKAQCGNQGSPQPGSPRSQRAAVQA